MGLFDFRTSDSAKLAAEIEREQQQADAAIKAAEDAHEAGQQERNEAILAGDEKAVDKLDAKLSEKVKELRRKAGIYAKRVELLKEKHAEAIEREESGRLDAIAASAEKARKLAEEITRKEYLAAATALADVLNRLAALDEFITQQNRVLERADRDEVHGANAFRLAPSRTEKRTSIKRVHISRPEHPHHEEHKAWEASHGSNLILGEHDGRQPTVRLPQSGEVQKHMDVSVDEEVFIAGDYAEPLWKAIKGLPGLMAGEPALYTGEPNLANDHVREAVQAKRQAALQSMRL
jgi:hypothetical protein